MEVTQHRASSGGTAHSLQPIPGCPCYQLPCNRPPQDLAAYNRTNIYNVTHSLRVENQGLFLAQSLTRVRTVSRGCGPWRLENPLTDSLTGLLVGGSGPCPTGPSTGRPRVLTTRRPASRRAIGPRERVPKRAGHRLGPDFRSHITVASSTGLWSLPSLPWPALPPKEGNRSGELKISQHGLALETCFECCVSPDCILLLLVVLLGTGLFALGTQLSSWFWVRLWSRWVLSP